MNFEEFKQQLMEDLKDALSRRVGTEVAVEENEVHKLQQESYDGIVVRKENESIGVNVDATRLYSDLEQGRAYEDVLHYAVTEVVVAMNADSLFGKPLNVFEKIGNERCVLLGEGIAYGVGDVDNVGSRIDSAFDCAAKIFLIASRSILGRELNPFAKALCIGNALLDVLERLFGVHFQLIFKMNGACCKKNVDNRVGGILECLCGAVDIRLHTTGKSLNGAVSYLTGYG